MVVALVSDGNGPWLGRLLIYSIASFSINSLISMLCIRSVRLVKNTDFFNINVTYRSNFLFVCK
jgi:hypothetical protein